MGDLAIKEQFMVTPNVEVNRLWLMAAIAEKEKRVKHLEADKEAIIKSHVLKIDATIMMTKMEITKLNNDLSKSDPKETIDVTPK